MQALAPTVAAELADAVYEVIQIRTGTYSFQKSPTLERNFSFDLSSGPIKGQTGGFLGFLPKTSGIAVIGQGKGEYSGHYVIAMRGTKTLHDGLTDLNFGLAGSLNGSAVHAGFNNTFESMRPGLEGQLKPFLSRPDTKGVHCVGHSLGGALASLTASWVKIRFQRPAHIYSFGSPRVGLENFAQHSTFSCKEIFRCTHGADVVPKVPLWPFMHAPVSGNGEYRLDAGSGISKGAHSMGISGNPGYRNTAKGTDWTQLRKLSSGFLNQIVRLNYEDRHQAQFSAHWADRLSAALVTLLKDAGYYSLVLSQAAIGTALTFYDLLAQTLEKVATASSKLAEQVRGLLGHMLVFARVALATVADLTYRFIKWVFDQTLGALYRAVKQSLDQIR